MKEEATTAQKHGIMHPADGKAAVKGHQDG